MNGLNPKPLFINRTKKDIMSHEPMTNKEKRMMEAARLRYMEDMSNQEIADRLPITEKTVRNYFSQEDMDQFKRFYSDQQIMKLERSLEQDVKDGNQLANNLLARAIQHDDADDKTLIRAAGEAQKIRQRKVELLQELGVLEKPKERSKVETDADTDELREELVQGLQDKKKELMSEE